MFRRVSLRACGVVLKEYQRLVSIGTLIPDSEQEAAAQQLQRLFDELIAIRENVAPSNGPLSQLSRWAGLSGAETYLHGSASSPLSSLKGLYLWGGVGCGKTFLMDLFYKNLPWSKKRRTHFHQFMLEAHKTLAEIRVTNRSAGFSVDLFEELAQRLCADAEVLCFDEMVVADIADAMILRRLFGSFYQQGIVAVVTSNRHPAELYKDGLNRDSFLPFIRLLQERCVVHQIQSLTDYRLAGSTATQTYFFPFSDDNRRKFEQLYRACAKGLPSEARELQVFGRAIHVPCARGNVCRYTFAELCGEETAKSSADYVILAKTFHTFFIESLPSLGGHDSNAKRRFIALIDVLYEHRSKVAIYAEVGLRQLAAPSSCVVDGVSMSSVSAVDSEFGKVINEGEGSFQMQRCLSRLEEMQSAKYLRAFHREEERTLATN